MAVDRLTVASRKRKSIAADLPEKLKKHKKSKNFEESTGKQQEQGTQLNLADVEATESDVKNEAQERARRKRPAPERQINDAEQQDEKYSNIRRKFERSAKLAKQLQQKEKPEAREEEPVEVHGLVPFEQPSPTVEEDETPVYSSLPSWMAKPMRVSADLKVPLDNFDINKHLMSVLKSKDYNEAFAVQSAVLPLLLDKSTTRSDLCISAPTGSGKTLAYALPMVEALRRRVVPKLRGLIVVPTRELVVQAKETCDLCAMGTNLRIATAYGKKTFKEEQESLIRVSQKFDPKGYKTFCLATDSPSGDVFDNLACNLDKYLNLLPDHTWEYASKPDILVCTPGRLVKHIKSTEGFSLKDVEWLVIDEADRLLNESFQEWVDTVLPLIEARPPNSTIDIISPGRRRVQKIILSATMTQDIGKLMSLKLKNPKMIVVGEETPSQSREKAIEVDPTDPEQIFYLPSTLKEFLIPIDDKSNKPLHLLELLRSRLLTDVENLQTPEDGDESASENEDSSSTSEDSDSDDTSSISSSSTTSIQHTMPAPAPRPHGILVFTHSNESAQRLEYLLTTLHPTLTSNMAALTRAATSKETEKILTRFRAGKLSILIATDRASRGLDLPNLAYVVSYDVPVSVESYVHRVGRTARANRQGQAFTLVEHQQGKWFSDNIVKGKRVKRSGQVKRLTHLKVSDHSTQSYQEALRKLGEAVTSRNSRKHEIF